MNTHNTLIFEDIVIENLRNNRFEVTCSCGIKHVQEGKLIPLGEGITEVRIEVSCPRCKIARRVQFYRGCIQEIADHWE